MTEQPASIATRVQRRWFRREVFRIHPASGVVVCLVTLVLIALNRWERSTDELGWPWAFWTWDGHHQPEMIADMLVALSMQACAIVGCELFIRYGAQLKKLRVRFSLSTLLALVLLIGSAGALWLRCERWERFWECLWQHTRAEYWWGVAWLPEFWLTLLLGGALVWSVWRDRRSLS
ncbi:MAG TPA: hypothetical protein VGP72_15845 [Planctomycetota bacterium]|jgi:hypothetical protein